jgi:hypothetical protein
MVDRVVKRKVACLVTGVPRGFQRCLETLRFLLAECDVTYFAVIREEFATEETIGLLRKSLPELELIVVPTAESQAALATPFGAIVSTVVQMWYEIWYGTRAIKNKDRFDLIFRTRFDIFFQRQFLPITVNGQPGSVWIPDHLNWSGSNDMVCLARPKEFTDYASVYLHLGGIACERHFTPEAILSRSLALNGLVEEKLDVYFILYRAVMFGSLSDRQLQALTYVHPALSTYKLGTPGDSETSRQACIALIDSVTRMEAAIPLFSAAHVGGNFFALEVDPRDGRPFRWMGQHAQIRRALTATTRQIRFTLHFHVKDWAIEHLRVAVDGNVVELSVSGHDAFGRAIICGTIDMLRPFRRPWSRITLCSAMRAVPSKIGTNPDDHRNLSVAIGDFEFIEECAINDKEAGSECRDGPPFSRRIRRMFDSYASAFAGLFRNGGRDAQ